MKSAMVAAVTLVLIFGVTAQAQQPAFPGAEGAGAYSAGGRGGDVYHVTNLSDYSDYLGATETPIPGSLRYGLRTATGPRTIVFDISGYIDLHARLEFGNHYITIAGQTAPADGITLRHWDVRLYQANNAIVRFIRIRPGYYADQKAIIDLKAPAPHLNGGLDCLSNEFSTNIIVDHCSFSWSPDEMSSITSDSNDITIQWTYITEPLNWNNHAFLGLQRPAITGKYTHHHNLYMNCIQRVSRFGNYNDDVTSRFDWVNNVAHNWGPSTNNYGCTYNQDTPIAWNYTTREGDSALPANDGEFIKINFIKNYFKPASGDYNYFFYALLHSPDGSITDSNVWAENNYWNGSDPGQWAKLTGSEAPDDSFTKMTSAFPINGPLKIDDPTTAYNRVLTYGGNWFSRDSVDTRLINQVINGTGAVINKETDVGGYPTLNSVSRSEDFDTDDGIGDGMPDAWEIARGLDPDNPDDRNDDRDDDGYTNLEEYLNYLVLWHGTLKGDFNNDSKVDCEDLASFLDDWLVHDETYAPSGDLNGDKYEDFKDFAIFAANWTGP